LTLSQQQSSNQKEIQQLSKTLLDSGITNVDIQQNYDLLELVLRDSKAGLQRPLYNQRYSPIQGGFVPEPAYEADQIHPKYEVIYDPVELFRIQRN
jgi:hypothetical protein